MTLGVLEGQVAVVTGASSGLGLGVRATIPRRGCGRGHAGTWCCASGEGSKQLGYWGNAHVFIVTRPQTQKMDTVYF